MTDRELLELIAGQVGALTLNVDNLTKDVSGLTKDVSELKEGQSNLKRIVIDLEEDHGKKLTLLLGGYKQNADKLDRIEKEVSKREEIILRRVK